MNPQKKIKPFTVLITFYLLLLLPFYVFNIRSARSIQVQDSWQALQTGLELPPYELRSDHLLVTSLDAEGRCQIHYNQMQETDRSELTSLIDQAWRADNVSGTLKDGTIYYWKVHEEDGVRIALFDAGPQQTMMRRQILFSLGSSLVILLPVFFLFLVLTRRAGRLKEESGSALDLVLQGADRTLIDPHRLIMKAAEKFSEPKNEKQEEWYHQLLAARSQSQLLIPLLEGLLDGLQDEASGRIGGGASDFSFLTGKTAQAYESYFYRWGKELDYGILPGLPVRGDLGRLLAVPCNLFQLAAEQSEPGSLTRATLDQDVTGSPVLTVIWDGVPLDPSASKRGIRDIQPPSGSLFQLDKAVKALGGRLTLEHREGQNQIRVMLPGALADPTL